MFIAPGTLIDNKYEVINSIGVGGMGVVYEAYHRSLERVVAVKMLTATTTVIVASLLPLGTNNAGSAEKSTASGARDQLDQVVKNGEAIDESQAKLMLSLIETYKDERDYSLDRSNLVLRAYQAAIAYYQRRKDFGPVRKYCQQALQECRGVDVDNRYEYLSLVLSYHDACVPVNCQLSLIPQLEDSLKQSPNADLQ